MARPGHCCYVDDRVADHDLIPPSPLFSVSEPTDRTPFWLNSYSVPRSPTHPHLPTPPGAENKHFGLLIPICLHFSEFRRRYVSLNKPFGLSGPRVHLLIPICLHLHLPSKTVLRTCSRTQTSLNDLGLNFDANSDEFGFHRSRGLTNGLEYTYSSPSAYTSDRGMSSARGKCASCVLTRVITKLTSTLPKNLEFPIKHETLLYDRHIPDFPTYSPLSDRVYKGLRLVFKISTTSQLLAPKFLNGRKRHV
ncbi:hypothetical protein ONZ45_g11451 [Pleurotus djamor]|nr:hypothetical protein ONZ45_g11451 [Pleurotus djamor]